MRPFRRHAGRAIRVSSRAFPRVLPLAAASLLSFAAATQTGCASRPPAAPMDEAAALDARIAAQVRQAVANTHCRRTTFTGTRVERVVCQTPEEAALRDGQADIVLRGAYRQVMGR